MSLRTLSRWFLVGGLLILAAIIGFATLTSSASAQCENPPKSSCFSCHAQDGHIEVMGDWNEVHLKQDLCTNCHGGNGSTMDKDLAHEGMVAQPLSDIYTDCHSCHPADYTIKSAQMAATLNVTPASCATPTAVSASSRIGGLPSGGAPVSSGNLNPVSYWADLATLIGILAILAFFILGVSWLNRHHSPS